MGDAPVSGWPSTPFGYPIDPAFGSMPGWSASRMDGGGWDFPQSWDFGSDEWSFGADAEGGFGGFPEKRRSGADSLFQNGFGDGWRQGGAGAVESLSGIWGNASGEYFAVRGGRFMLWSGATNRVLQGSYRTRGNKLRTYLPGTGQQREYSYVQQSDTLVLIDSYEQVLIFRRIQSVSDGLFRYSVCKWLRTLGMKGRNTLLTGHVSAIHPPQSLFPA